VIILIPHPRTNLTLALIQALDPVYRANRPLNRKSSPLRTWGIGSRKLICSRSKMPFPPQAREVKGSVAADSADLDSGTRDRASPWPPKRTLWKMGLGRVTNYGYPNFTGRNHKTSPREWLSATA
jgi:hypothetical protein